VLGAEGVEVVGDPVAQAAYGGCLQGRLRGKRSPSR